MINLKKLQGDAINEFEGGMVLVSHDFRLINQVAEEIWICEKGTVTKVNKIVIKIFIISLIFSIFY